MKKTKSYLILLITLISAVAIQGCKKENSSGNGAPVQGTISLEVHAVHHSWDISGIMIYMKRNATEFPGKDSSIYEYKGQADGYGKYTFENLYPGNYFVYASGYDAIWGSNVIGYMSVVLDKSHLTDNELKVTLFVSE